MWNYEKKFKYLCCTLSPITAHTIRAECDYIWNITKKIGKE